MNSKVLPTLKFHLRMSSNLTIRNYCIPAGVDKVNITTIDEKPVFESKESRDQRVHQARIKSRLSLREYNIIHDKVPYPKEMHYSHQTVKYKAKILGRYGLNSINVNPGIFWPSEEEVEDMKEFERVARPIGFKEGVKQLEENRKEAERIRRARDDEIHMKMAKVEQWKKDLDERIKKKEAAVLEAKKKKDRLIEEVRQHFGFKIDTKDERFQALIEQKEKEERKAKRAVKKKQQSERLMTQLLEMSKPTIASDLESKESTNKEGQ